MIELIVEILDIVDIKVEFSEDIKILYGKYSIPTEFSTVFKQLKLK